MFNIWQNGRKIGSSRLSSIHKVPGNKPLAIQVFKPQWPARPGVWQKRKLPGQEMLKMIRLLAEQSDKARQARNISQQLYSLSLVNEPIFFAV